MGQIDLEEVRQYVESHIHEFHDRRLESMENTDLKDLVKRKNPYLFKAKHIETAPELIDSLLSAKLSSSEEEMIGDFLEGLARFVAGKVYGAHKSGITGFDFEHDNEGTHYLFAIKSGENWGNSSQWDALEANCKLALKTLSTSQAKVNVKCFLGICYGKSKSSLKRGIIRQVSGQEFWFMISGQRDFYKDIVEPIGHKAKEQNEAFNRSKARLINRLTRDLTNDFCNKDGDILWDKLVRFNSGNLPESSEDLTSWAKAERHEYK
jgi:hypothetical protein